MNSEQLRKDLAEAIEGFKLTKNPQAIRQMVFELYHNWQEAKNKPSLVIKEVTKPDLDALNTIKQLREKIERLEKHKKHDDQFLQDIVAEWKRVMGEDNAFLALRPLGIHKIMSTDDLRLLCQQSVILNFDHVPPEDFWDRVDPCGPHKTGLVFLHSPSYSFWHDTKRQHNYNFAHNNGFCIRAEVKCILKGLQDFETILCDFDEHSFVELKDSLMTKQEVESALKALGNPYEKPVIVQPKEIPTEEAIKQILSDMPAIKSIIQGSTENPPCTQQPTKPTEK